MTLRRNKVKSFRTFALGAGFIASMFALVTSAGAQSLLSGDITGTVTDPTTAVVVGASVDLKGVDTGSAQSTKTDSAGVFRFSLLRPGRYSVSVTQTGFQTAQKQVTVSVGQITPADIRLAIGQASQTIEVTSEGGVLNPTPSGNTTSFTPLEVELLPSAGGDITNIAETSVGVIMNTTGGSANGGGNFSMNGLPATSNLFTVNGENDMDPYFNINNSGATNLTIGQNEIQEATVIASPYGGQYGQLSGAQVIQVTKSGSNAFHGNAIYWWNGRDLNSNSWFNNDFGTPRPFSNANEWAASLGGRIIKNRTFFFVDDEGLRFVLPNSDNVFVPTQAFATAVLNNVSVLHPGEAAAYKSMLGLLTGAPGAASAVPVVNSSACNALTLPGFNPATQRCTAQYEATPSALAKEYIVAFRIDHKLTDRDNLFYRYRLDHGVQPSVIDAVNPNFDALSSQPQWDNQLSETHVFSPNATNQFLGSFSHYVAQFAQNPQAVASTFPWGVFTNGTVPYGGPILGTTGFNGQGDFPQGRNITQYQFVDDYTLVKGRNTFKFGENFRRYDVSDHNFFYNNPQVYFGFNAAGLQNFANGLAYQYRKSLNIASDVPIGLWGVGMYAHDEVKVTNNLTVTFGVRFEHNSNPVCQFNCFSNLKGAFNTLASVTNANPGSVPYSADLNYGQHQAYSGVDVVNVAPSVAFSWSPMKDGKTVLSGGFGLFYDNAPASLIDSPNLLANPPAAVALRVRPAAGVLPFDPGPQGGAAIWQASASAFNINQTFSQISANLKALGTVFAAPSVTGIIGTVHSPRVAQWNFQVQRQITQNTGISVNYIGNFSREIPYTSQFGNAYDEFGLYPGVPGIPAAPRDPNYGQVSQIQSGANSNYEAVQITVRKQFSHAFAGHLNYTFSHALDEVSNGGVTGFSNDTTTSLLGQGTPYTLQTNYGNADYDIRHTLTADFIYTPKFKTGSRFADEVLGGWQVGSKIIYHTGLPFSIVDSNTALGNFSDSLMATPTNKPAVISSGCGEAAVNTPCLNANAFVDGNASTFTAYSGFSPQTRNQFRGPGYFNMDLNVYRSFQITERIKFALGMTAFNFLNHPNFAIPGHGYGDATYGLITSTVSSPSTPYGNGLGFDGSIRVIQLTGKITF
jgi:hypothetical protein